MYGSKEGNYDLEVVSGESTGKLFTYKCLAPHKLQPCSITE